MPPIVTSWEVEALKAHIAKAQRGEAFVLQGGDCAPRAVADCTSESIVAKLKILLQMSLVMLHGLKKPVVRVGRMAGQYAKPRSADTENAGWRIAAEFSRRPGSIEIHSRPTDRIPDPQLILRGYETCRIDAELRAFTD